MPTITANAGSSVTLTYVEVGGVVRGRETWSAWIRTMGHILFPPGNSVLHSHCYQPRWLVCFLPILIYLVIWGCAGFCMCAGVHVIVCITYVYLCLHV